VTALANKRCVTVRLAHSDTCGGPCHASLRILQCLIDAWVQVKHPSFEASILQLIILSATVESGLWRCFLSSLLCVVKTVSYINIGKRPLGLGMSKL
jgi:hypothetical protein